MGDSKATIGWAATRPPDAKTGLLKRPIDSDLEISVPLTACPGAPASSGGRVPLGAGSRAER